MGNLDDEVRAYTRQEVRGEFLTNLYVTQSVLDKQQKQDGLSIAYTVLSTMDEGTPLFEIIGSDVLEDIGGELHSLILNTEEELKEFEKTGKYPPSQRALVNAVRILAFAYDKKGENNSHKLIADILRLFDQGIGGMTYEVKAIGNPEDIEYFKSLETNYYPEQGENIAGKLAFNYNRIVEACKVRTSEVDSMFLVPVTEITPPKHM
jgi:hypothetical protein